MQKLVDFIKNIYQSKEFVPLHEPKFVGNEKKYVCKSIDSTFVSSIGKYVDRFEKDFAFHIGSKYAIATVNGTSALHTALLVADVKENDEVITQPLTFVATCNSISYIRAKPIFVDVDLDTMGLSAQSLQEFLGKNCEVIGNKCINKTTNRIIKACVPMHTFGHPCKIDVIKEICDTWHISLVEDAAESLGSMYNGKNTGTFGKLGVFSFNGNKIITSGGGGVIVTDDEALAKKAKHLTTTAKVPHAYEFSHDTIAYNYRMPNLNAALLVAQLEQLDGFVENKRALAQEYSQFFENFRDVEFMQEPHHAKSNYWLNAIVCKDKNMRDRILEYTNKKGVMTRPVWTLMNELEMFQTSQKTELPNAKYLEKRVVNLPSSVRV